MPLIFAALAVATMAANVRAAQEKDTNALEVISCPSLVGSENVALKGPAPRGVRSAAHSAENVYHGPQIKSRGTCLDRELALLSTEMEMSIADLDKGTAAILFIIGSDQDLVREHWASPCYLRGGV